MTVPPGESQLPKDDSMALYLQREAYWLMGDLEEPDYEDDEFDDYDEEDDCV